MRPERLADVFRALVVIFVVIGPGSVIPGEVELRSVGGGDRGCAGGDRVAEGQTVVIDADGDVEAGFVWALEFEDRLVVAIGDFGSFSPERFPDGVGGGGIVAEDFPTGSGQGGIGGADRGGGGKDERFAEGLESVAESPSVIESSLDVELLVRAVDRDRLSADYGEASGGQNGCEAKKRGFHKRSEWPPLEAATWVHPWAGVRMNFP
jgi:hypothetical protein